MVSVPVSVSVFPFAADHQRSCSPVLHAGQCTSAEAGGALFSGPAGGQKVRIHLHPKTCEVRMQRLRWKTQHPKNNAAHKHRKTKFRN